MHIVTFFDKIAQQPAPPEKVSRLEQAEINDTLKEDILNTFLADPAYDQYYSTLFLPLFSVTAQANYPLACLQNFGMHQLTMRRFYTENSQIFLQIGGLDGHEFICALMHNVSITGHLVHQTGSPEVYDKLCKFIDQPWNKAPQFYPLAHQEYLQTVNPSIGFLSLVGLPSPTLFLRTLSECWESLHQHADILLQGETYIVEPAVTALCEQVKELRVNPRRFNRIDEQGMRTEQTIAVFQKYPFDYPKMIDRMPSYS
jgi:hypothetical protein